MSRRQRLAIILLGGLVVLGLLVSFAPQYIARYLVASQLDEYGIDYEGVDTIKINPWTQQLWLGPVRFSSGPSDQGRLGEVGLDLRFSPLLKSRISIDRLLVRGVDLVVTRSQDGVVALNGIPLSRFISPPEEPLKTEEKGSGWGAGADVIELLDSRLIFDDRHRGDLEVEVARLTLREFETWTPDRPGLFELAAKVNGVQLNWSGEARPFADNVTLAIDSRTQDADVPKIVRFTGPWGLDRREGTYDAALKYEMTLFDSGRIEGHTRGSIGIDAVDYQRAGKFELKLDRADLDLDVRYSLSESGDFALQGQLAANLGPTSGALGEETRFGMVAGRLTASNIEAAYPAEGGLNFVLQPDVNLQSAEFSGPIKISVDSLLDLLVLLQSLSAGAVLAEGHTGLGDFADSSMALPASDIWVEQLTAKGDTFSLASRGGQVQLALQVGLDLANTKVGFEDRQLTIAEFSTHLERFDLNSGGGQIAIDLAGSKSLSDFSGAGPIGEIKLAAFDSEVGEFAMQAQTGVVSLRLAAKSRGSGFSALLYPTDELPEARVELAQANVALGQASMDAKDGGLRWQVEGDAVVDSLGIEFAKSEEGALKFTRAEGSGFQANERLQIAADALTVDGLDLYLKRSLLEGLIGDGGEAGPPGADPGAALAGDSAAELVPTSPDPAVDLRRLQTLLTALGYEPGPVDGRFGRKTARAISDFQGDEGLPVDGRATAELLAALEARASEPRTSDRRSVDDGTVSGAPSLALKVGHLALTGDPVLRFRDDLVEPQVNVDSVFKQLEVRNLDIGNAGGRTDLSWVADVNEFTRLEVKGWVAGLGETADLELDAKLENLELSTYSPYVAKLAGVYLDSGQLDTLASAKAERGVLQGEIQLELDDLAFQPLSPEDSERIAGTVGVPLETAVELLQDNDGHISLKLPVSGPVTQPQVDVSSAVSKAIGGALKKVFPPTMVASMLSGVAKGAGPGFEPIEFAPGSAELSEAGKQYADGVGELLSARPKLSLKVCGRATAQDLQQFKAAAGGTAEGGDKRSGETGAMQQQASEQTKQALTELAVERQQVVRRYLIQERGADANKIHECRSTFEDSDTGPPRVEISL